MAKKHRRFPKKTRPRKVTSKAPGNAASELNWFQKIPLLVKLLFVALIIGLSVLIYWRVKAHFRQKDAEFETSAQHTATHTAVAPVGQIHLLLHLYRGNPDVVARTIFGAFEAAKYPGLVHVHLFQELCVDDNLTHDVYECYTTQYARRHSWDVTRAPTETRLHVVNENPAKSLGYFMSLLVLAQESVLPIVGPDDVVLACQAFYDSPGTAHLFPLTFAQDYDNLLRAANLDSSVVYSGRIPRTSLSATNANQVTTLTSSFTQAISTSVIIPFFKAKEHGRFLESRIGNTCSATAARNLATDQAGFPSYTTSDRLRNHSVRQTTNSDVPFTVFRMLREFDKSESWSQTVERQGSTLVRPVPIVGIHEDAVICTASTWLDLVRFAHGPGRIYVTPGPAYIQTLTMSNLVYEAGFGLCSMNHLPVLTIFDHLTGAAATVDPVTLTNARTFRPRDWKVVTQILDSGQRARIKMSDPCDVLVLGSRYEWYAGVTMDNVTQDGFLGITAIDAPAALLHKFRTPEELDRQRRMLAL